MINDALFHFWAKTEPFHPLIYHLIDVGAMFQSILHHPAFDYTKQMLAESIDGFTDDVVNVLAFYASLHDIGKLSFEFQNKADVSRQCLQQMGLNTAFLIPNFRHEYLSCEILNDFKLLDKFSRFVRRFFLWGLKSHHAKNTHQQAEDPSYKQKFKGAREDMISVLRSLFLSGNVYQSIIFPGSNGGSNPSSAPAISGGLKVKNFASLACIFLGTLILADWLVSNVSLYDYQAILKNTRGQPFDVYLATARGYSEQMLNQMEFGSIISFPSPLTYSHLFSSNKFSNLRPIQIKMEEMSKQIKGPGVTLIEAPMGEGKTEAALFIAAEYIRKLGLSGLYFALPTAATSNQMFGRVYECLKSIKTSQKKKIQNLLSFIDNTHIASQEDVSINLRLVHSTAWLLDDISAKVNGSVDDETEAFKMWFNPSRRGILAPYCVGTVDQIMKAVMNVRFSILRLFGLINKVLIIDEIHSYDVYMMASIEMLIRWASVLKIPIVLLSATLPQDRRIRLFELYADPTSIQPAHLNFQNTNSKAPYPLITHFDSESKILVEAESTMAQPGKTFEVQNHFGMLDKFDSIVDLSIEIANQNKCVCLLLDTVDRAQKCFELLESKMIEQGIRDIELDLFHARYVQEDRNTIESMILKKYDKESLKRPKKSILVATQVVEQSLDVDFDELITDIAPIDLLIQRFGRVHRHDRPNRTDPNRILCHILLPDLQTYELGSIKNVYSEHLLVRTIEYLKVHDKIILPDTIRDAIESVYGPFNVKEYEKLGLKISELLVESANYLKEMYDAQLNAATSSIYPIPSKTTNNLATENSSRLDEEDQESGNEISFFHIKTRYGDYTNRYCLVEDNSQLLAFNDHPSPEQLKQLYMHTVSLPKWWFEDLTPEIGYSEIGNPSWFRGVYLIKLKQDKWVARSMKGKKLEFIKDKRKGIVRKEN